MAYQLVGSLGPVVESTNGGTPGALSFGQTPTANNLLICWQAMGGSTSTQAAPGGWSSLTQAGTSCANQVFWKVAAGGDAAPSFAAVTSATQAFMLGEFSGNATGAPLNDRSGITAYTTSPNTATAGSADLVPGELYIAVDALWYTGATTATNTTTSNNATLNDTNNSGLSDQLHYNFGWGITTTNATQNSLTVTFNATSITGGCSRGVSFKVLIPNPLPSQRATLSM